MIYLLLIILYGYLIFFWMNIKVLNLSKGTTEDEIVDYFGFCGEIDRIRFVDQGECMSALIRFRTSGAAKSSLFLSGTLIHDRKITVLQDSNDREKVNILVNEDVFINDERKDSLESIFGDVVATGQSLSKTMMEKLWEFDETYKISEYIKALTTTMHEKYESSGAAQIMRSTGVIISDNAVQTWAEALKLLGGRQSSKQVNYNTFEQV